VDSQQQKNDEQDISIFCSHGDIITTLRLDWILATKMGRFAYQQQEIDGSTDLSTRLTKP
jgi:hypothetical protein